MSAFAIFETPRGARRVPILKVRVCPAEDWMLQFAHLPPGQRAIEVADDVAPGTHMMVRRAKTGWGAEPRPALPVMLSKATIRADDRDAALLSGLPTPCVVTIDGVPHEVTDGELWIRSPMPATYEIRIDHWPYLPWAAVLRAE
jgi:hypothetical protein